MCGIASIVINEQHRRSREEISRLVDVFTNCLLFNEARGRDASGVVVIQRDGSYHMLKAPVPVSQLIKTQEYKMIMAEIGNETVAVLGHARKPTKGSPLNNLNNHPVQVGSLIGVHNGIVQNDNEIFQSLGLRRKAEVDTEALFTILLEQPVPIRDGLVYCPREAGELKSLAQQYARRLRVITGSYAFLAVDTRCPGLVLLGKYMRPLSVHYNSQMGVWFFSSRYIFLRKAFGKSVITEAIKHGTFHLFDGRTGQSVSVGIDHQEDVPLVPSSQNSVSDTV